MKEFKDIGVRVESDGFRYVDGVPKPLGYHRVYDTSMRGQWMREGYVTDQGVAIGAHLQWRVDGARLLPSRFEYYNASGQYVPLTMVWDPQDRLLRLNFPVQDDPQKVQVLWFEYDGEQYAIRDQYVEADQPAKDARGQ